MTISWVSNEIRDYLIARDIPSAEATKYQSLLQDIGTLHPDVVKATAKDSTTGITTGISITEIVAMSTQAIMKIFTGIYLAGIRGDSTITTWIVANIPEYADNSTTLGYIITHMLSIVGSPTATDTETVNQLAMRRAYKVLSTCDIVARYYSSLQITSTESLR